MCQRLHRASKASKGCIASLDDYGVWGSVVISPSEVRGGGPKLNFVKSECQRSHLVAGIPLNFVQQFHSGYWLHSCVHDY